MKNNSGRKLQFQLQDPNNSDKTDEEVKFFDLFWKNPKSDKNPKIWKFGFKLGQIWLISGPLLLGQRHENPKKPFDFRVWVGFWKFSSLRRVSEIFEFLHTLIRGDAISKDTKMKNNSGRKLQFQLQDPNNSDKTDEEVNHVWPNRQSYIS